MKKEKFSITIPEPCTERWSEMTPADRGRFCAACQKTVIDFSALTDQEIISLVKLSGSGTGHCGRFRPGQLGREFVETKTPYSLSSYLLKKLAACFLFFETITAPAWAQTGKAKTYQQYKIPDDYKNANSRIKILKGCVTDYATYEPVPDVIVQIKGTDLKAITGIGGTWALPLPDTLGKGLLTLQVHYTEAGMAHKGTIIADEEVDIDSLSFSDEVMLYRYPADTLKPARVTAYRMPLIDVGVAGGICIASYERSAPPKEESLFYVLGKWWRKKLKHHD